MDPQSVAIPSSNVIMRGTPVKRMIMAKPVIRGSIIGSFGNHSTTHIEEEPRFVECPLEFDKDSPLPEDSFLCYLYRKRSLLRNYALYAQISLLCLFPRFVC